MTRLLIVAVVCAAALAVGVSQASAAGWLAAEAVQTESGAPSGSAGVPVVAVNRAGAQAVAWEEQTCGFEGCTCTGAKVTTRIPGGDWAPAATIGCKPRVVIGAGGQVFAFWTAPTGGTFTLYAASAAAGQSFGTPVVVDTATTSYLQIVGAVDAQGVPTVAWLRYVSGAYNIYSQTR